MIYGLKPKFEITIYNVHEDKPIDLPMELVEQFTYSDNTENTSFTISIPDGFRKGIKEGNLRKLLYIGNVVQIKEDKKPVFTGYITSLGDSGSADAEDTMVVSGGGIEDTIRNQILYIDASELELNQKKDFNIFASVISGVSSPGMLVYRVMEAFYRNMFQETEWGGYEFSKLMDCKASGISQSSYTKNCIMKINMMNPGQIGKTVNFWDILSSSAKPPLYELFVHYNTQPIFIDSKQSYEAKEGTLSNLVFRKTPIEYLKSDSLEDSLRIKINQSRFDRFNLRTGLNDVFTGVTLTPGFADMRESGFFIPTKYNTKLRNFLGQRVFNYQLEGFSLSDPNKYSSYKNELKDIQGKVYDAFGSGEYVVSGSFSGDYNREICKGKFIDILDDDGKTDGLNKHLAKYHNRFYVKGITVSGNPGRGEATMETEVCWGKWKDAFISDDVTYQTNDTMLA